MDEGAEGNVLDVLWVLSEETGQLMYESFKRVHSKPKQRIVVAGASAGQPISEKLLQRWARINDDRKERGVDG